jgi:hypothetical protein
MKRTIAKNSFAPRFGFLCVLASGIFFLIGNQAIGMACLSIWLAVSIARSLFKISVDCITMALFCHSMRMPDEGSMAELDEFLED